MGFPLTGTASYRVVMGTCLIVKGDGICRQVPLKLSGLLVEKDFLTFELGSSDVILGMQWLRILGKMQVDWNTLTMSFDVRETK